MLIVMMFYNHLSTNLKVTHDDLKVRLPIFGSNPPHCSIESHVVTPIVVSMNINFLPMYRSDLNSHFEVLLYMYWTHKNFLMDFQKKVLVKKC